MSLKVFVEGRWRAGEGSGRPSVKPSTGPGTLGAFFGAAAEAAL